MNAVTVTKVVTTSLFLRRLPEKKRFDRWWGEERRKRNPTSLAPPSVLRKCPVIIVRVSLQYLSHSNALP